MPRTYTPECALCARRQHVEAADLASYLQWLRTAGWESLTDTGLCCAACVRAADPARVVRVAAASVQGAAKVAEAAKPRLTRACPVPAGLLDRLWVAHLQAAAP